MSPEQVLGNPATFPVAFFALGVVMHEMLTGSHPFRRPTSPEILTAILREIEPSLRRAGARPVAVAVRVIDRCLEKQPCAAPGIGA